MTRKAGVDFLAGFRAIEQRDGVQRQPKPAPLPAPVDTIPMQTAPVAVAQPSRRGKVAITYWDDPLVRKQIAQLGLDLDRNQADLVAEALNLLFEKYGKSPIAAP
jgi:hypothetical protein